MVVSGSLPRLFASLVAIGNDAYPYDARLIPSLVLEGAVQRGLGHLLGRLRGHPLRAGGLDRLAD